MNPAIRVQVSAEPILDITFDFFIIQGIVLQERNTQKNPFYSQATLVVVAERLRQETRNLLGVSRAGSNPTDYVMQSLQHFGLECKHDFFGGKNWMRGTSVLDGGG